MSTFAADNKTYESEDSDKRVRVGILSFLSA